MKLCMDCAHFVQSGKQCSRGDGTPDYVFGHPVRSVSAQLAREYNVVCGPTATHFKPIQIAANDYANAMVKRDQLERHQGTAEQDLDAFCRKLEAGR